MLRRLVVLLVAASFIIADHHGWYRRSVDPLTQKNHHGIYRSSLSSSSRLPNDNQTLACLGWRRQSPKTTTDCGNNGFLHSLWHRSQTSSYSSSCDRPIPLQGKSSGWCELQAPNGTIVRALYSRPSCHTYSSWPQRPRRRHRRPTLQLTCNMAADFLQYQHDAKAYRPNSKHRNDGQDDTHGDKQTPARRGIVMAIYDDVIVSAYAVIQLLRSPLINCTLPIELWSLPSEQIHNTDLLRELLRDPTVTHHSVPLHEEATIPIMTGFMIKPYSLFYSSFDQVLLMDADTIPVRDPTYLFDTAEFRTHGAMFFLDYWSPDTTVFDMTPTSLLWELLGIPFENEFEMESGQVLIDKSRSQDALHVLMFLAQTYDSHWLGPLQLVYGDKDLFRFAWRMTNTSYFYNRDHPPGVAGFPFTPTKTKTTNDHHHHDQTVCGVTLVQQDPQGQTVFFHRNTIKLITQSHSLEKVWYQSLTFVGDRPLDQQYRIQASPITGRKIKCYHPTSDSLQWFQIQNLTGTPIERIEHAILTGAQKGLLITAASGLQPLLDNNV